MFFKRGKGNKSIGDDNKNNGKNPPLDLKKHADFIRETQEELEKLLQKKKLNNSAFRFAKHSNRDSIELDDNKGTKQQHKSKGIDVYESPTTESSSIDSKEGDTTSKDVRSRRKKLRRTLSLPSSSRVKSVAQIPSSFTPRKTNNRGAGEARPRATTTVEVKSNTSLQVKSINNDNFSKDRNTYKEHNPSTNETITDIHTRRPHQTQTKRTLSHKLSTSDIADSVWEVICQQSSNYSSHFYEKIKAPTIPLRNEASSRSDLKNCNTDDESPTINNEGAVVTAEVDDELKENTRTKIRPILHKQVARADLSLQQQQQQQQQPSSSSPSSKTTIDGLEKSPGGSLVMTKVLNIEKEKVSIFYSFLFLFLNR